MFHQINVNILKCRTHAGHTELKHEMSLHRYRAIPQVENGNFRPRTGPQRLNHHIRQPMADSRGGLRLCSAEQELPHKGIPFLTLTLTSSDRNLNVNTH